MNHGGSGSAYRHYGCRCVECVEANTKHAMRRLAERRAAPKDPDDPRHGSESFYVNHGCRCDPCSIAHAAACKERYERRKSRTP